MIICTLARIRDATSLPTSAEMIQRWPKNLRNSKDILVFVPHLGFRTQPMSIPDAM